MKQRAHAWTALRALKLLDDSKKAPKLVELLSYYLSDVWDGAWIPDTLIADMNYGHIFKMESDPRIIGSKTQDKRAKVSYKELKSRVRGERLCLDFLKSSDEVSKHCWSCEGFLPNRVIALSHTAGDMLKIADYPLAFYAKKQKNKKYIGILTEKNIKDLSLSPCFSARQIALVFFMLSHYICDCHMPLHCDARDYTLEEIGRRLSKKLHPSIEERWESYFPEKKVLALDSYTKLSVSKIVEMLPNNSPIKIDSDGKYSINKDIGRLVKDEWSEMVSVGRISFALAREWIDQDYEDVDALIKRRGRDEFKEITNYIFHDAVQNIAMVWYKAWERYIK